MKSRIVQAESGPGDEHQADGVSAPSAFDHPYQRDHGGLRAFVARHRLASFFAITYLITWCLLPVAGTFLTAGPLIAALVVVWMAEGVAGLRDLGSRMIRWRVRWYWWVAAVAVPVGVHFLTIAANVGFGADSLTLSQFGPWTALVVVFAVRLIDPLNGPMGEEPGFRGFAQPELQRRHSPLVATSILSVLVVIWHAPLMFYDEFGLRPIELLTTVAVTFWYAWLFNHTGGSVLLTIVAHATEGTIETDALWNSSTDITSGTYLYAAVWVGVAVALLLVDWRFWTGAGRSVPEGPAAPRFDQPSAATRG